MRGRRTGVGGRGRGRGDVRNRSPSSSKIKGNRSGYRSNPPLPHHRPSRRSLSPPANRQGPRRSLSPLTNRPRRSPIRRSPSIGRGRRERDYAVRPSEHGKHQPPSFDDQGIDFRHKYMLPDHPTDLSDVHALLKSSRAIKDKNLAGSSSGIDSQGMLVQKSMFLDDGSKRAFYTLPQDSGHSFNSSAVNLSDNVRSIGSGSSLNVGMPRYDPRLRDLYDDKEREELYSKDISFQMMPPPSQVRPLVSASSSSFSKDADLLRLYGDRGGVGKFLDEPLEYSGYNQAQLSDHMRRPPVSPPSREEPLDYGYDELGRRGRDDQGYLQSDRSYHKTLYDPRGEFKDANDSSFLDLAEGRVDRPHAYHKKYNEGSFCDQQHSVHATMDFRDLKGVHEDYVGRSGSGYAGLGPKASRDHELPPFEESYRFGRDVAPVAHRGRPNSPLLVDHPLDAFRYGVSPPREKSKMDADFDTFDRSPERMLRRNYIMTDDPTGRNVHRRIQSPHHGDEMRSNDEYGGESRRFLPLKRAATGHSHYRMPSHKQSRNDGWGLSSASSAHMGGGRGISLKKRLRPGPSDFCGSFASERRQDSFRPHKVWKRGQEDRNDTPNALNGDVPVDAARRVKNDPPEDSDEFKQQVHKAFLRFSKLLNDSPHQQKRFRDDQGKSSKLLCCVCGSLSKEFVDIHSLLTHSYHTLKVGFRTEHLGFHKALCVLNGWNWLVVPDTSKSYRRTPPSEINALKEDLILWPPIVIIHNSSIANRSTTNGPQVVSIESLEEILKEKGFDFDAGKTRVCRGKPANQSVLLVKFMPTLSGLQEAERLHKYYADNNRGRQGFQKITSNSGRAGEARVEKDEELLYGYMAIAEDLDKLDPETKKRSLVKSKKDIEAIADAPLKID